MRGLWACLRALTLCALAAGAPQHGAAQDIGLVQSEILVLDIERFFSNSKAGARLTAAYQAERDELISNNNKIAADLRAEEQALTERRPELSPEEFRDLADAFDAKVRAIRQENERAALDLERRREVAPLQLMRIAEPVLVQIMRDAGAVMIVDHRQVLLRADVIDITDLAIARVDEAIGDGTQVTLPLPDDPPAEDGAEAPVMPVLPASPDVSDNPNAEDDQAGE